MTPEEIRLLLRVVSPAMGGLLPAGPVLRPDFAAGQYTPVVDHSAGPRRPTDLPPKRSLAPTSVRVPESENEAWRHMLLMEELALKEKARKDQQLLDTRVLVDMIYGPQPDIN